jgi:hypothetical protein
MDKRSLILFVVSHGLVFLYTLYCSHRQEVIDTLCSSHRQEVLDTLCSKPWQSGPGSSL